MKMAPMMGSAMAAVSVNITGANECIGGWTLHWQGAASDEPLRAQEGGESVRVVPIGE